ncbi:MAG: hypothetical protein KDB03_21680 [Planctomycetales bacterium]|nr:hypothetical protein [Planctomycetales bacterium]
MRSNAYERPVTFFDIVSAIFKYRWRAMFTAALVLAVSVAAILLFPKKYESEAKMFVRLGRSSASLDTATIGQTISIQESRETEMNSIIDMLESRALAECIVNEIGQARILKKYAWAELQLEATLDKVAEWIPVKEVDSDQDEKPQLTSEEIDELKEFEKAVKEVQGNLKIDSPKKSTTISLAFRGRTPDLAQDVVTSAIKNYQHMHIAAYQSQDSLNFFDEQFAEQERLVSESENAMRETKNLNEIVTMEGQQQQLQSEITDVKKLQLQTKAELHAALARLNELENNLDILPRDLVSSRTMGIAENATDAMRDRLYALEIEEKDLAAKFLPSDPRLVRVRTQLESARSIMNQQPKDREQNVVAVNPVWQQIQNELLIAKAGVAALEAKISALDELESGLLQRLAKANDLEIQSDELKRRIEIARENHRSYARKLEESRINTALDQQALSNVSVVGSPTLQLKHVSPKQGLLGALSLLFSALAGIMVALVSDYTENSRELAKIREAERKAYLRRLTMAEKDARPIAIIEKRFSNASEKTQESSPDEEADGIRASSDVGGIEIDDQNDNQGVDGGTIAKHAK